MTRCSCRRPARFEIVTTSAKSGPVGSPGVGTMICDRCACIFGTKADYFGVPFYARKVS